MQPASAAPGAWQARKTPGGSSAAGIPKRSPKPRAILHIGLEKTGTTSVQAFLALNRAALAARGFRVPILVDPVFQHDLCLLAQDDEPAFATLRAVTGTLDPGALAARRAAVAAALTAATTAPGADEAIFLLSSEFAHSNLVTATEVARLAAVLGGWFASVRILVYLRRQDRLAISLLSSRLGGGEVLPPGATLAEAIFPYEAATLPYYFNYAEILANYAAAFGPGALIVREHARPRLIGGDVVADVCASCAIPPGGLLREPAQNTAFTPAVLEMLAAVNPLLPPGPARDWLMALLVRDGTGAAGPLIGRAEAARILAVCAEANAALPDILGQPFAFDGDLSSYPPEPPRPSPLDPAHAAILAAMAREAVSVFAP